VSRLLWLVDIGNTRVKVGLWRDGAVSWRAALRSDPALSPDDYYAGLRPLLPDAGVGRDVGIDAVIASVVPALTPAWHRLLQDRLGASRVVAAADLFAADAELDYPSLAHLGDDRVANIVAARALPAPTTDKRARDDGRGPRDTAGPAFILGLGTATTLDAWAPRRGYLGSAITCGLELSARSLAGAAALLPAVEPTATATAACGDEPGALRSGLFWGHVDMLSGLLRRFAAQLGHPALVVATGGWAEALAPHLPEVDRVVPDLTFTGLALAGREARPRSDVR